MTGRHPLRESGSPGKGSTPGAHARAALAGLRAPIVVILLLIAFFSAISGKPLDGTLMLAVALCLAWDTGRRAGAPSGPGPAPAGPGDGGAAPAGGTEGFRGPAGGGALGMSMASGLADRAEPVVLASVGNPVAAAARTRIIVLMVVAGGALYAAVTGSFGRYSWPATVAVVLMDVVVITIGWQGPRRPRRVPERLPLAGLAAWGVVFVAGCLWELTSLLLQPSLTTSSYAHPTISTLTDPLLAASPGRTLVLAAWLGLGWFLVER